MLILDFDKQISLFAPGKCGSSALAYNLHDLTILPNHNFREEHLKFISTNQIANNYQQLLDSSKEFFYSMTVADSYSMYRTLYNDVNFTHYVFDRKPVSRIISGFETVINYYYNELWQDYQNGFTTLDVLWSVAKESKEYDYHIGPYLHRTNTFDCQYLSIDYIDKFLLEKYNIEAKHIPSVPFREIDDTQHEDIQHQVNKFRIDTAFRYKDLIKNSIFDKEVKIFDSLDIKE